MTKKPLPVLIGAVFSKDMAELNCLLGRPDVDVNERDQDGRTPLNHAANDGKLDFVEALLLRGADPDLPDTLNGYTALHSAAQGWHVEVVRELLKAGAKVDAIDNFGNTPLWRAVFASKGSGEVIKVLLENGADRNMVNAKGTSPIILAKRIANYNVAQYLT